jgi:hypothetical protein
MLLEKLFAAPLAFLCEHHRFRLPDRIQDHSLFVKTVHGIPIMPLPGTSISVERKTEKPQDHLIDFILVVGHALSLSSGVRDSIFVSKACGRTRRST